jgi:hypothetical protein
VRQFAGLAVAALCVAGCAPPATPAVTTPAPAATPAVINPARVDRVRTALPPGYEVADLTGRPAPSTLWGFGPARSADPVQCAVLGDPGLDVATQQGWSASGPGGIVYAVVAAGASPPDPALAEACPEWTLTSGHTNGTVTRRDAPPVPDAVTFGLAADVVTTVEGGTETRTHADTALAFFGGHVAVVTVVTDPGASQPPLPPGFAADLLAKTVSALPG